MHHSNFHPFFQGRGGPVDMASSQLTVIFRGPEKGFDVYDHGVFVEKIDYKPEQAEGPAEVVAKVAKKRRMSVTPNPGNPEAWVLQ